MVKNFLPFHNIKIKTGITLFSAGCKRYCVCICILMKPCVIRSGAPPPSSAPYRNPEGLFPIHLIPDSLLTLRRGSGRLVAVCPWLARLKYCWLCLNVYIKVICFYFYFQLFKFSFYLACIKLPSIGWVREIDFFFTATGMWLGCRLFLMVTVIATLGP